MTHPLRWQQVAALGFGGCIVSLLLAACSVKPAVPLSEDPASECLLVRASDTPSDTLSLAVTERRVFRQPSEYSVASDRLLYGQLYDNLFSVDCIGLRHPSLAVSWEKMDGGSRWRFAIDATARLRDGSPLAAERVAEFLLSSAGRSLAIDSIRVVSDKQLDIYLHDPSFNVPDFLASPDFAVVDPDVPFGWPLGTADYSSSISEDGTIMLVPDSERGLPVVRVEVFPRNNQRDLIDKGTDLMIVTDLDVVAYARSNPDLRAVPLPYDVVYVLISPTRFIERERLPAPSALSTAATDLFSEGAVRAEVRSATGPYWWSANASCGQSLQLTDGGISRPTASFYSSTERRILYESTDAIARDIADRLVALSSHGSTSTTATATETLKKQIPGFVSDNARITAEPLRANELNTSLRAGDDFAYVIPIPIRPFNICTNLGEIFNRVPWLAHDIDLLNITALPLVDTRPFLIVRDNVPALSIDWFGSIVFGKSLVR